MKNMTVYPLGTVVRTHGTERYMLTGYVRLAKDGSLAEYAAVRFPQGNMGIRSFRYFNSSDITEVLFEGYKDDSFEQIEKMLHASTEHVEVFTEEFRKQHKQDSNTQAILE